MFAKRESRPLHCNYLLIKSCILSVITGELPALAVLFAFRKYAAYCSAHPLTPPRSCINARTDTPAGLTFATYRSARLHLLTVLRSMPSASATARITKVNGSVVGSTLVPIMLRQFSPQAPCATTRGVPLDQREHGTQKPVDGISATARLKVVPRLSDHRQTDALQTNFVCGRLNPEASALGALLAAANNDGDTGELPTDPLGFALSASSSFIRRYQARGIK